MAVSQLPLEIWALVIDYLIDDIEALRVCSLIQTRFIPLARKHLFEDLLFEVSSLEEAQNRYNDLEPRFPVITPYVQTLEIAYCNEDRNVGSKELARYVNMFGSALGAAIETLCLRKAFVFDVKDSVRPATMELFPRLRCLAFQEATFQSADLMAGFLLLCPLLQKIELEYCDFDVVEFHNDDARTLPPLDWMKIAFRHDQDRILPWLDQAGIWSTLRCLNVTSSLGRDYEKITSLIASSTPCLTVLIIKLAFNWQPPETYAWPTLTSDSLIVLEIAFWVPLEDCCPKNWTLSKVLETIKAPALKKLRLELNMHFWRTVTARSDDGARFPLDRFPALRRLSVFFTAWGERDMLDDRIRTCDLLSIFIAAREKGILRAYFLPDFVSDRGEPDPGTYFDGHTEQRA